MVLNLVGFLSDTQEVYIDTLWIDYWLNIHKKDLIIIELLLFSKVNKKINVFIPIYGSEILYVHDITNETLNCYTRTIKSILKNKLKVKTKNKPCGLNKKYYIFKKISDNYFIINDKNTYVPNIRVEKEKEIIKLELETKKEGYYIVRLLVIIRTIEESLKFLFWEENISNIKIFDIWTIESTYHFYFMKIKELHLWILLPSAMVVDFLTPEPENVELWKLLPITDDPSPKARLALKYIYHDYEYDQWIKNYKKIRITLIYSLPVETVVIRFVLILSTIISIISLLAIF